jgi:hypothetical protein
MGVSSQEDVLRYLYHRGSTLVSLPLIIVVYLFRDGVILSYTILNRGVYVYTFWRRRHPNLFLTSDYIVMVSPNIPSNDLVIGLGLAFLLTSITILILNKRQRETVFRRLHFRRRRTSEAKTPPRSFSLENVPHGNLVEKDSIFLSATPNYINTFPPSRRSVLRELPQHVLLPQEVVGEQEPPIELLRDNSLPTTRSYSLESSSPKYTPTGFSTDEIRVLGDFPTYDILSGVPLPRAYKGFDASKALPRPYRPFRWTYHQTMCKYFQPRMSLFAN